MVSHYGGEGGEEGCQEHTDIPDVDGDVEEVQHVVDGRRCDHQACGTDTTLSAELFWLAGSTRGCSVAIRAGQTEVLKGQSRKELLSGAP